MLSKYNEYITIIPSHFIPNFPAYRERCDENIQNNFRHIEKGATKKIQNDFRIALLRKNYGLEIQ